MIYLISKLFTYTLLPPAIFVWGLLLAHRWRKVALTLGLLLWLLSTQIVSRTLLWPLEEQNLPALAKDPGYVVVLGGGYDRGALATSAGSTERILTALILAKNRHLPLIYTGYEAEYAKKSIETIQKGFDFNISVIYEKNSLDTFQNAKFCTKLLPKRQIYLVTSAYHMPRAYRLFRHFGFLPTPVKTDFKTKPRLDSWAIFPRIEDLRKSYLAIHEYVGLLSLWLRGL